MARFKAKFKVAAYRGTRIREIRKGECWQVDFTALGEQERKRFNKLVEAKTWIDQKTAETKNKGLAAFGLGDRDRLDIAEARALIGNVPLSAVVAFWTKHHPTGELKTVEFVIDDFLSAPGRRGSKIITRREATTEGHRKRLLAFKKVFDSRLAHEVTQGDVEQFLDVNGWTGLNRRHYLATLRALFNHALRKQYIAMNPALGIELPDAGSAEPVIMAVGDVAKYLKSIEADCPELLSREAIAFFCGLRPEELTRLDWKNISIENKLITVSGDVAKVQGHRRNVEMPDNLLAWLAPYALHEGRVWPFGSATTLHNKRASARAAAGVDVPDNAGRHAFASYHLALHENAPKTAEAMGHADIDLLRNVYRNIVASDGRPITKRTGEGYFRLMPERMTNQKVLYFQAAS